MDELGDGYEMSPRAVLVDGENQSVKKRGLVLGSDWSRNSVTTERFHPLWLVDADVALSRSGFSAFFAESLSPSSAPWKANWPFASLQTVSPHR